MPNVNNPATPTGNFQPQRVLTNGPAVPVPGAPAPVPGQAPVPMGPDQAQVNPAIQPRDPQILQALSMYGMQLNSSNPVEVSAALSMLESFGPAYRDDVVQLVLNNMSLGQPTMKTQVYLDALVRWDVKAAASKIQMFANASDPVLREAASEAYGTLLGLRARAPMAGGPAPAALPGAPGVGATPPGAQGAPGAAQGVPPGFGQPAADPTVTGYVERLKKRMEAPKAALEISQLPTAQILAITQAILKDPTVEDGRVINMLTAILAKRVRDPGVMDVMRQILNTPKVTSQDQYAAKARAAVAMLNFGTPADLPGVLRLLPMNGIATPALKKVIIDVIASKPAALEHPTTIDVLTSVMNQRDTNMAGIAAAHALGNARNAKARDALGTSKILSDQTYSDDQQIWTLGYLEKHPAPYSAATVDILRRLTDPKRNNKAVIDKATALLKKTGA